MLMGHLWIYFLCEDGVGLSPRECERSGSGDISGEVWSAQPSGNTHCLTHREYWRDGFWKALSYLLRKKTHWSSRTAYKNLSWVSWIHICSIFLVEIQCEGGRIELDLELRVLGYQNSENWRKKWEHLKLDASNLRKGFLKVSPLPLTLKKRGYSLTP